MGAPRRYRAEGETGLLDRSSAPRTVHNVTPPDRVEATAALRRLALTGPEIAELLEMATSTVSALLKRIGLGKLSRLDPPEPIRRYERSHAGELIHIDVKKLGRMARTGRVTESPVVRPVGPSPSSTLPLDRRHAHVTRMRVCRRATLTPSDLQGKRKRSQARIGALPSNCVRRIDQCASPCA